jgi:hypothetical protein
MRDPAQSGDGGTFASDRFEVRRHLGRGGFGEVYEAFDRERSARVAIKLLRRTEPEDLYRFKQEFRALADLTHPNLVRLYDLVVDGPTTLFTMELVEGVDFVDFVRPDGRTFDELRLRSALVQLAEGLAALHAAGKLHRDVTPSNVLVTREGRVVIVDFGLAARLTRTGELSRARLMGTPEFLAPEVINGHPVSTASDWYAVGVLLFEALTGRTPFVGPLAAIMAQKLSRDPAPPSAGLHDVPRDLDELTAELLARRPEGRPTSEEILARLGGSSTLHADTRGVPFVGRSAERARLADLFRALKDDGTTTVALIGGPSGMGKSALVELAVTDIRRAAPGAVILGGRCYVQESVPYKAIDAIVDPLSRHLAHLPARLLETLLPDDVRALGRVFPVLDRVPAIALAQIGRLPEDAVEARRRAFQALREVLTALGSMRPLVLVIDDLQWGDRESAAALLDLLAPPTPPLLLIAAYRDDEVATSPCLELLLPGLQRAALRGATITLEALPEGDVRDLCRALLPSERAGDEALLGAIARESGGRPFFVRELVGLSAAEAHEGPAVSVDALVRARAHELPDGARALLELLSVAGRPVDRAAAARAADLGDDEPAATHALHAARLTRRRVVAGRDEVEVYHDRIREAVVAGLSEARRTASFRRLATALDGSGRADPETLSVYFFEGGDRAKAADYASIAAAEAGRAFAFDRAARLYRRVLELCPGDEARRGATLESLGEALAAAGRSGEAGEALREAAEGAPPERALDLRRRATEHLLCAGEIDEGMVGLRRSIHDAGMRFPDALWKTAIGLLVGLGWLWLRGFGLRERVASPAALRRIDTCATAAKTLVDVYPLLSGYFAVRAATLALAGGDLPRATETVSMVAGYLAMLTNDAAPFAIRAKRAMDALVTRADSPRAQVIREVMNGLCLGMNGNRLRAVEALDGVCAELREHHANERWAINITVELTFMSLLWSGSWRETTARLPGALAEAREHGNRAVELGVRLRVAHLAALLADDPEAAAHAQNAAAEGWWPAHTSTPRHHAYLARADIALYADRGRGSAAQRLVEATDADFARAGIRAVSLARMYQLNVRARAALAHAAAESLSEPERAAALLGAERAASRLARMRNPMAQGLAPLARASLLAARGDREGALAALAQAEERLEAVGCRHYLAAAKRRRGELRGDAALVAEADAFFREQGAKDPARMAAMLAPGAWRSATPGASAGG